MKRPRRVLLMLRPPENLRADYLFFIFLFLLGIALGHLCGGLVKDQQHQELADYILSYARSSSDSRLVPFLSVFFSYFRVPAVLFLFGLAACGTWLVPLLILGHSFFLAYSVHCFGVSLGRSGVLLAFAAFGVRCLFVLPCVFYLASRSWNKAARMREGGSLRESSAPGIREFYPIFLCCIALLIGCIFEISMGPQFLSLVLSRFS